jgi:hypothetical protein
MYVEWARRPPTVEFHPITERNEVNDLGALPAPLTKALEIERNSATRLGRFKQKKSNQHRWLLEMSSFWPTSLDL